MPPAGCLRAARAPRVRHQCHAPKAAVAAKPAWSVIGIWYIYRCIRGWLRFNDGRTPY